MKKKLRKIVVGNSIFLYVVKEKYSPADKMSQLSLRIFLNGQKNNPLLLEFRTKDDFFLGSLLNAGVHLHNSTTNVIELVNINRPKYIRAFIESGLKAGWTGFNKIEVQDGLLYLLQMGFQMEELLTVAVKES